jgi:hypothetical protein
VASGGLGVSVGQNATASSTQSISIGAFSSATTGAQAIAIGSGVSGTAAGPQATAQGAIAIGASNGSLINGARAGAADAIAIGSGDASVAGASASAADSIALGRTASAAHSNAVAVGQGVSTTTTNQVNIGTKRLFAGCPTTAPASGDLVASQVSFSVNEAGNLLTVTVKYADGTTVKSGTVALV